MASPGDPLPTHRPTLLARLAQAGQVDLLIIGGGATGLGVAVDAASRGWSVLLLEAHDFAKGTSSRSTKLVHGGVRYLAQGHWPLVHEALQERSLLLAQAPHLARPLPFIIPAYRWWERPFYGLGLQVYEALAGRRSLGATRWLSAAGVAQALPNVKQTGLRGGVAYWDGQFDDARLALALARTAARQGALLLNHCPVTELLHVNRRVAGVRCADTETGKVFEVSARCVVNATGVWSDGLRQRDGAALGQDTPEALTPSQGVHLVVDRDFLPGHAALMVPRTRDGRVLFAVPWLGKLILGTTDTPGIPIQPEPQALDSEVDFILSEAGRYLARAPQRADVRSAWAGLRPLVRPGGRGLQASQAVGREHLVEVARSGLVSVMGGKWTTYRAMAAAVLDRCVQGGLLPERGPSRTQQLPLCGSTDQPSARLDLCETPGIDQYGSEAECVLALEGSERWLGAGLSEAMVRYAARYEYARTVEDVLARRSRHLFLDARQARNMGPSVAQVLQQETGVPPRLNEFTALAERYDLAAHENT